MLGTLKVRYQRGPDMGGGVGGLLYTLRGTVLKYSFNNGRGDIVAQHDSAGALTWSASYEACGKRPVENGTNADRQRANSKDEDPTGLLNEGFRYRDLETGVWLSRDPAGFVDGPNLYAYVRQNSWSCFDPTGLAKEWHHDLPQEHADRFAGYGIDVHDSKNGSFMEWDTHSNLHKKANYNSHWADVLDQVDKMEDSAAARKMIMDHMTDIRDGKVAQFASHYKDAVRVGAGLNYMDNWHWKDGNFSSKQRGQVIAAAIDANRAGKSVGFEVAQQLGRKTPFVKYAIYGSAMMSGKSFAQDKLGLSGTAAYAVGHLEAINPLPVGLEDLYDLGEDQRFLLEGRHQSDMNSIYHSGKPLYELNYFNVPPPPDAWTRNPSVYFPELLHHWGVKP